MAELTATPDVARRSPVEAVIDRIWRFFCSVRAAIVEISCLAVLVLIGTLRGSEVPQWIADAVPFTEPLVKRWYNWDVFKSTLFVANCTILAVAIAIGGMINRIPALWRTIQRPTVRTSYGFLRNATPSATLEAAQAPDALVSELSAVLRNRRYRVLTERHGDEVHLYADKNRFGKLGTFPFHLALILIMVGGIVGARFGFRETEFIISEGETKPIGHGTGLSLRLDQFSDTYYLDGNAKRYESDLVLLRDGNEVKSEGVTVNNPMTYRTVSVYQSGFGQNVVVRITNAAGEPLYEGPIEMGIYHSATNPDAPAGTFRLVQAGVDLTIIGPDANPFSQPELDTLQLATGQLFLQTLPIGAAPGTTPTRAIVNTGQSAAVGGINVEFIREGRYAVLQVGRNPGVPIFVIAAILLVGGLAVTFYFPHRRIRAILATSTKAAGSTAHLAPLARRDWSGQRDFQRLLEVIQERLQITPNVLSPAERTQGGGEKRPARPGTAKAGSRT